MTQHKQYLGDSVYVDVDPDSDGFVLTTENCGELSNTIYVEAKVYHALVAWLIQFISRRVSCKWIYDDTHDKWDTECGNAWQFMQDTPAENGVKFCMYCGGEVLP
jgi:hypothetical protein